MTSPPRITLGRGSYCAEPPEVVAYAERSHIWVGRYSSIAKGVRFIIDAEHDTRWVTTSLGPGYTSRTKGDVLVGSDVWVGAFATVLSGVTIGDGAVVGAAAVVARDVPPYAVVVGNPARVVRYRFPPETVARLLAIRWWDWPEERVAAAAGLIWSDRVDEFVARHGPGCPDAGTPVGRVVAFEVRAAGGGHCLRLPVAEAEDARRAFERHEFGVDPSWLRAAPVVLDAAPGAGAFAAFAALAYHPGVAVHCFECRPDALGLLRANAAGIRGVAVHPHALGAAAWDGLGLGEVGVLRLDAAAGGPSLLAELGPRLARVRVALVTGGGPGDREACAALLPGHVRFVAGARPPGAGVLKLARADLVARGAA
jgi:carbonic anhydrase/acetyltransferase-like protein (isoleucine patch superfamily)